MVTERPGAFSAGTWCPFRARLGGASFPDVQWSPESRSRAEAPVAQDECEIGAVHFSVAVDVRRHAPQGFHADQRAKMDNVHRIDHAVATPAAFNAGPAEPTVVWYGIAHNPKVVRRGGTYSNE